MNSFLNIDIKELQIFAWGMADEQSAIDNKDYISKFNKDIENKFSKVKCIEKFESLINFKFTKKYNLFFGSHCSL